MSAVVVIGALGVNYQAMYCKYTENGSVPKDKTTPWGSDLTDETILFEHWG